MIIFNCLDNKIIQTLKLPFHISTTLTSLDWSLKLKLNKKNKIKKNEREVNKSYISCGSTNGSVFIWNAENGELLKEIKLDTKNQVNVKYLNTSSLLISNKKNIYTCFINEGEKSLQ